MIMMKFWDTNRSSNLSQTVKPSESQQNTKTWWIEEFAVPSDNWVEPKENEKRDKCEDLARELKKLWNIKVTWRLGN